MSQPIKLSIGMIVKNEAKNLPHCLEALKPILEELPSELIITDTGSTDNTVEIAKQYTDKVLYFQWCNDFSAARNTALKIYRGEWFWFLDADEWMEDVTPLIRFLKSKESDQYRCIRYEIRSYVDMARTDYTTSYSERIFRRRPDLEFVGKIHEGILYEKPVKMIDMYAHHSGYAYIGNEALKPMKHQRNIIPLLEELKEKPDNLRTLLHIIREYDMNDMNEEMDIYLQRAFDMVKDEPDNNFFYSMYARKARRECDKREFREAIRLSEEYLAKCRPNHLTNLDIYAYMGLSYMELNEYEEAIKWFNKYFELYKRYKHHEKMINDGETDIVLFITEKQYNKILGFMGYCYQQFNDPEKAYFYYDQVSIKAWPEIIDIYIKSIEVLHQWQKIKTLYHKCVVEGFTEKVKVCLREFEQYYIKNIEERAKILDVFSELNEEEGEVAYFRLNHIRYLVSSGHSNQAVKELEEFKTFDKILLIEDRLYSAIQGKLPLEVVIGGLERKEIEESIYLTKKKYADLTKEVYSYHKNYCNRMEIEELYWNIQLMEWALLAKDEQGQKESSILGALGISLVNEGESEAEGLSVEELSSEEKLGLFDKYVERLVEYMQSTCRLEMINDTRIVHLSERVQFAYYMKQANEMKQKGDLAAYVRGLNKAISVYPIMTECIQLMLNKFEEEQEEARKAQEEMAQYTSLIKAKIEQLFELGMTSQIKEILTTLVQIMPHDADIIRYQSRLALLEK